MAKYMDPSMYLLVNSGNPLLQGIGRVLEQVGEFVAKSRKYYLQVLLSQHQCPKCLGRLKAADHGRCACSSCRFTFDPTLAFQRTRCCGAKFAKRVIHYACSRCGQSEQSRFLVGERVFDAQYFRDRMKSHREKAGRKREELRRILSDSRSDTLILVEPPRLERIPGLVEALDEFTQEENPESNQLLYDPVQAYDLISYRAHIKSGLGWAPVLFSEIPMLYSGSRLDKVWRFMTLLFMDQAREVDINQYGEDLMIRKLNHEADE